MIDLNTVVTATIPVAAFALFLFFFNRISQRTYRVRRVVVAAATTDLELQPPTPQEVEVMKGAIKINADVDACPRCGEAHEDLEFTRFEKNAIAGFTHFGTCPKLNSPILIRVNVAHDSEPVKQAASPQDAIKGCGSARG